VDTTARRLAGQELEDVNQGYRDLLDGRNIRGLIVHEH